MAAATLAALLLPVPLGGCGRVPGAPAAGAKDGNTGGGVPRALALASRPIGRGPRFQPPVRGPALGACRPRIGPRFGVHAEVFLAGRVVIVPRGIGLRKPIELFEGRVSRARCYGALVTVEPTGVVLVRPGGHSTLGGLFRSWGESLDRFPRAYVDGRPWAGATARIPLTPHAEIVVEAGPFVPPHRSYTFPPGS